MENSSQLTVSGAELAHASASADQQSHEGNNQPSNPSALPHRPAHTSQNKSQQVCRFFKSKGGCRAGQSCRYRHELPSQQPSTNSGNSTIVLESAGPVKDSSDSSKPRSRHLSSHPKVVAKPVSAREQENPREYQISQVVRRYSPFRADLEDVTSLKFRLNPTDPDFPFELETGLHCVLGVPLNYPQNGRPSLTVQNPEMEKGFQINIEKGFDSLVQQNPNKSLLALLNELDKNLEKFLTASKAPTIKLVANKRKPEVATPQLETQQSSNVVLTPPVSRRYSPNQLSAAKTRRDAEIRQLEARLGRSEAFSKAGDGIAFNVPLNISTTTGIPASLRSVRETALIVPDVYPLEPPTIILKGVDSRDAELVEVAFEKRAVQNNALTLMSHINHLTQNIGKMAVDTAPEQALPIADSEEEQPSVAVQPTINSPDQPGVTRDPLRPHIQYIARPPEWDRQDDHADGSETDTEMSESETGSELDSDAENGLGGVEVPISANAGPQRGIMISFPKLGLTGIGVLQLVSLSLSVRCDRCKEQIDMKSIKSSDDSANIHRNELCSKCTTSLSVTYRGEMMHQNSSKAGYIDVENCTITDLLPSTFQPTCLECSTIFPSPPGVTAVRGDKPLTVCRSCHAKMTFSIPEVRFLRVSATTSASGLPPRVRKPKENLGIISGSPLPDNGKCPHYSKSYRWFRFSCCNRVFPCDKCHDAAVASGPKDQAHPNEHAERMICGWCSREQRYHPDTCRMCGRSVVRKFVTSGFWEGGKGTREKGLMSRKEGRKYKTSGKEKKEKAKKKADGPKGRMWWPE